MTVHTHAVLAGLLQLGLLTAAERDDAIAELDIAAFERAHPSDDDIDVPQLAVDANAVDTLAWLLLTDLLPEDDFLRRVRDLPRQHGGAALLERQQLAAAALQQVNCQAVDALYQEDLIDQWQRDAAHAIVPQDRMLASPIAALRFMLGQGTLSARQFDALRTRRHGSELARLIVEGAARQERPAYARPGTWIAAALMLLVLALAGRAIVSRQATAPAAAPVTDAVAGQGAERHDLQQRAAQAVESARMPGAEAALSITVVQDGATPAR